MDRVTYNFQPKNRHRKDMSYANIIMSSIASQLINSPSFSNPKIKTS